MVCGCGSVRGSAAERFEDFLQLGRAGDDNANIYSSQLEKQAEIVQIPVEKRILVIPFNLDSHSVFEAIDGMRRAVYSRVINDDRRRKIFLDPTALVKGPVETTRDQRAVPAFLLNFRSIEAKFPQNGLNVRPFIQACRL